MAVDYNQWLWNYIKITQLIMFVMGKGGVYVKFWPLAGRRVCEQEGGGYKFWSFCDNIITECP